MKKCIMAGVIFCTAGIFLTGCSATVENHADKTNAGIPELRIGIDDSYEPYSYVDENGNYAGLDIELAKEACTRAGFEPVFVAIKWDSKNECLANGTIDCIWSCFSMNGREEAYNWVGPYMYSRQMVAVRSDSTIEHLSDLNDRRVAVMSSTMPESIFLDSNDSRIPDVRDVYCMDNMDLVFAALQSGYVDATAGHETVMRQFMKAMPGEYRLLEEDLLSVGVGVAFEKGEPSEQFLQLSQAMDDMREDGMLEYTLALYGVGTEKVEGEDQHE